jgi:hypothetical protein
MHDEDLKETRVKFDSRVFEREGLTQFIKLAIPSMIVVSLNWQIWEVYILLAGLISVGDQATQVITQNIFAVHLTLGVGIN